MIAADFGPLVPVDAEPAKAIEDRLQGVGAIAQGVGVVDAEDELAAESAREEPVEERGAHAADVEIPRGARGETCANAHEASTLTRRRK